MKIKHFIVGPVGTNCYMAINEQTKELVIIDPGDDEKMLEAFIDDGGFKPVAILFTHGHFDHMRAGKGLHEKYDIKRYIHAADEATMRDPEANCSYMIGVSESYDADEFLSDGQELVLAGIRFQVILTPGHTPGGVCFYLPDEEILFAGDTLFCESVGRTDFVGGSMSELVKSIKNRLFILPDLTIVYTGHGEPTKIGYEKVNNPFI